MKIQHRKWIIWTLALIFLLGPIQGLAFAQNSGEQETVVEEGEDVLLAPDAVIAKSPFSGAGAGERRGIDITLDNMDIYPVLDHVLGRILELNYVVDPAIKGTISLHIQGDYTKNELLNLLNSILQIHNLAITRGDQNLFKVVRKASSAKTGSEVVGSEERAPHPGDVIRVFQLQYLSAAHVIANLRNFISPGAVIVAESSVNAVLLVDTAENVAKVSKILAMMDTNFFEDIHWRLFSLENTEVDDLSKDLDRIFKTKGLYARQGVDPGGLQILPLKTINALLVVTKWEEVLDVVGRWVIELDQGQVEKGTQVYVYFVQNGQAKDLADMLKQLYGGQKSSKSDNKSVLVKREKQKEIKPPGMVSGELSGEVEIIADEINNAILIKARPRDYGIMLDVLEQIDVVPRQVLIDVLIVEIALDDTVEYGIEWFIKNRGLKISTGEPYNADMALSQGVTLAENTALGTGLGGFAYSLYDSAGGLRSLLTVIAGKTDINILSAPNILAVDNQESSIEVGEDVPTLTQSSINEGTTTQSVQYRQAGIILNVKPFINDSGLVRMEVTQEVSSVGSTTTGGINSPTFKTRKATTYLVAQSGQTILIGGLMQTQKEVITSGIPFLKDLPLLGYIFGKKKFVTKKTELLFAITPHVIKCKEDADIMTREFSEKVKSLREILGRKNLVDEGDSEQGDED